MREPNGLLAAGGDLAPERLLEAYRHGIFPWYSQGQPILWWSPDPRVVFHTQQCHIATRLRRFMRGCDWTLRADTAFAEVMRACAAPRPQQPTTWITPEMFAAYCGLHQAGHAHSVEVYAGHQLIGGIYGVAVGRMFFGESMFSAQTNASKIALFALCAALSMWNFPLLDAQVRSSHLMSLGAVEMARSSFVRHVAALARAPGMQGAWTPHWPIASVRELATVLPPAAAPDAPHCDASASVE